MKTSIKKIIVGMFGFALLFVAQNAFAATWNGASNDCRGISIANATTNEGYAEPCWPSSSVSADAGDTLNVRIYYHNTGTVTANNTKVTLSANLGGVSTSKSFSGNINSDQGGLSLSSVTANLSSSQTITFNSVKWYTNNTSVTLTSLLHGQSGAEILNGGLDIGSIAPGWATQGSLVISFHVSNTVAPQLCKDTSATNYNEPLPCIFPQLCKDTTASNYNGPLPCTYPPQLCRDITASNYLGALPCTYPPDPVCIINSFTANPASITKGDASSLNWNTTNCTNAVISNLGYSIPTSGSQSIYPTQTTTYSLTASRASGSTQTKTATVSVNQPPTCSISIFSANPTSITSGQSSTINWNTSNCNNITIFPTLGTVSSSGSRSVSPTVSMTYTITADGIQRTAGVNVNIPPEPLCKDTNATNYNGLLPCQYPPQLCRDTTATNYLGALPCQYPQLCKDTSATNYNGALPCQYPPQLCRDTTASNYLGALPCQYPPQLCKDTSATNYNGALPCNYTQVSSCTISSFTSSDTSISDGDSVVLRWNTNDCDHVKLSNYSGNVSLDGSKTVYPTDDTTYILTAYDSDGSHETDSIKIYVDSNNNNSDCSIDSFTASNTYINTNNPVTLNWDTNGCNNVSLSNTGTVYSSGSQVVYPINTTNYVLTAYGLNGGTQTRSILVTVNSYVAPITPVYNNCAVTTVATNINQAGAQLNGIITSTVGANTYFEYGTTVGLGYRTNSRYVNGNTNFNEMVTSLSPNTIYFFRMVSDCQNGLSQGSIEVFRTLGYANTNTNTNTVIRQVVVQGTTVTGSESPIMLQITNRYQSIGIGDIVDYTVYYKNISSSKLTNPMVQVFIPAGMTLINSSRGTYSIDSRTLSAPIEDLNPGAEGTIYLQARVDAVDSNLAQIVTTAVLVYTNPNGAQENAMAYVLNNPRVINLLGASAFFGNMFGLGLIGWLLLIIFILLLVLIARSLYNRRNVVTTTTQKTISQ